MGASGSGESGCRTWLGGRRAIGEAVSDILERLQFELADGWLRGGRGRAVDLVDSLQFSRSVAARLRVDGISKGVDGCDFRGW